MLGAGRWALGAGSRELGAGSWVRDLPGTGREPASTGVTDNIIRFPGPAKEPTPKPTPAAAEERGPDGLTEEQRKAAQVILSGMTFVCIGIKPSERGADFFTAVHGVHADLRNALDHLPGVIERAYARKGITT